jgi:hypothetical protein
MEKMNAITFTKTGHLLGVVTRASQPDAAASTEDIAAGGFRLRSSIDSNIMLEIPEDEISVVLLDYDTRVLYRPHLFALESGIPEQKTADSPPALSITLDGDEIEANLPAPVTSSTDVWCLISGSSLSEPIVRSVTIPGTVADSKDTGTEALVLGAGNYKVAMFAPEYALAVFTETVP